MSEVPVKAMGKTVKVTLVGKLVALTAQTITIEGPKGLDEVFITPAVKVETV